MKALKGVPQNSFSEKFHKIYKKTLAMERLLCNVNATLLKISLSLLRFSENFKIFFTAAFS